MREDYKVSLLGFIQSFIISANIYFISILSYSGVFLTGFALSYVWILVIRKTVISSHRTQIMYALGSSIGGLLGVYLAQIIK